MAAELWSQNCKLASFNGRSLGGQPCLRCGVEPVGGTGGLLPPLV